MAKDNQTPVPKVSTEESQEKMRDRNKPAEEHLDTGKNSGVTKNNSQGENATEDQKNLNGRLASDSKREDKP